MGSYTYRVFGITLWADCPLPGLMPCPEGKEPDVRLYQVEALPEMRTAPRSVKPFTSFNATELLLDLPSTARFLVRDGREIFLQPLLPDWERIQLVMQSSVLAALLYQRDVLPYHMSGVVSPAGRVWLFAGPSRVGKSTTALKLRERGYTYFTDDTVVFYPAETGELHAVASFPLVKAWKNTMEVQTTYAMEEAFLPNPEVEKYSIRIPDEFVTDPLPVAGIVLLKQAGDEIAIRKLSARDALVHVGQQVYRRPWMVALGKQRLQFESSSLIAQRVPVWEATRPKDAPTFDAFADALHTQILTSGG